MTTPTAVTVYSGRSTSWSQISSLASGLIVMGAMRLTTPDSRGDMASVAVVAIVLIAFYLLTATSVRTLVGPNGIDVRLGAIGWPRFRYPLEQIARASVTQLPANRWLWSVTWTRKHGLTIPLNRGPALHVELVNGRRVTISTPHPGEALRAIDEARYAAATAELGQ